MDFVSAHQLTPDEKSNEGRPLPRFEGALVRALLVVGAAPYSIYLWQVVVIKLIFPGQPVLGLAAAMIVGIGLWQLFERRLINLRPATLVAQFLAPQVTAFQRAMR
jgi:peptidoglycan/LPS O-acetylase OafA/YrhL